MCSEGKRGFVFGLLPRKVGISLGGIIAALGAVRFSKLSTNENKYLNFR